MPTAESVVRPRDPCESPDRREHERAPLDAPVLLDNDKAWRPARVRDVSAGGLCLACSESLPLGDEVEVYFELPSRAAVEARAVVVRCSSDRIGLRVVSLDRASRLALLAHCRTNATAIAPFFQSAHAH
jgi:hypothetical protein